MDRIIRSRNVITIILFMATVVCGQERLSIHIEELLQYHGLELDFSSVDSTVRNSDDPLANRPNLSAEVIGYLPYWEYDQYPNLRYDLLTQINYFSVELSPTGTLINDHNWSNLGLISYAHERGVPVKLCATLFGSADLTTLLSSPVYRQNAINNLLDAVLSADGDGVDIDFELLPLSQRENLVIFMMDLVAVFQAVLPDAIITLATPAIDWSGAWDLNALADITDGLFIMGYNYHYSGSSNAGPVAPLGGFFYDLEYTVNDYLDVTGENRDKLILGLPYYGYDWSVQNNQIYAPTLGAGQARTYTQARSLALQYGQQFDFSSYAPWIAYQDDGWQQCWYDDSLSLSLKYQYVMEQELSGVGIWALGYDAGTVELWDALEDHFVSCSLPGDLDQDGNVTVLDILLMVGVLTGGLIIDEEQLACADLNGDGSLDILDIVETVAIILGS